MNTKEIVQMATEAGLNSYHIAPEEVLAVWERFAALVAAKAAADEREACALVCDAERADFGGVAEGPMTTDAGARVYQAMAAGAANCAAAIRARSPQ